MSAFQLAAGLDITGEADHKTVRAINRTEIAKAIADGTYKPAPASKATAPKTSAPKTTAPAPKAASPKTEAPKSEPAKPASSAPAQSNQGGITLEQLKAAAEATKKQNE